MRAPKILIFAGSARSGSNNGALAALVARELALTDALVTQISLSDYPLPIFNKDDEDASGVPQNAVRLRQLFVTHQGIFIASPEYNGSLTPLLKNTIDWISRVRDASPAGAPFRDRVFALGAVGGGFGGVRGLMALRQVLELGLGATVLPEQILVKGLANGFDGDGNLVDQRASGQLDILANRLSMDAARYVDLSQ
jgi:chromate reductase